MAKVEVVQEYPGTLVRRELVNSVPTTRLGFIAETLGADLMSLTIVSVDGDKRYEYELNLTGAQLQEMIDNVGPHAADLLGLGG